MTPNLARDAGHGLRVLRKSPGFAVLAVFVLALGIGGTTAIFSLLDGIVLEPLPFPEPDRLVQVMQSYPEKGLDTWRLSQANFAAYHERSESFSALAAYAVRGVNLIGIDRAQRLQAARVTAEFFEVLGVPPALGRPFLDTEGPPGGDAQGASGVCILSDRLWRTRLGGDPGVVGRTLILDDVPVEVVGVMPPGFSFPAPDVDLWVPLGLDPTARFPWFLTGVGRLLPEVDVAAAQTETTAILWSVGRADPQAVSRNEPPEAGAQLKTLVVPLKEAVVGNARRPVLVLQIAVLLILLVACANIANFLLSRSFGRQREVALRHALGASRRHILNQFLTESVVLAFLGGAFGLLLAWWGVRSLGRLPFEGIPRIEDVGIDGGAIGAAVVLALVTGLLCGLAPAYRSYRLGVESGLADGDRGSTRSGRRMNRVLVVLQLALSLVLLIGAGLMLRSLHNLLRVDPGFATDDLLTMVVPASSQKYPSGEQAFELHRALVEAVSTVPGVESAAMTSNLPFSGFVNSDGYVVEGHEPPGGGDAPQVQMQTVTAGYFRSMGIERVHGRDFDSRDREDGRLVTIVDETLAGRFWDGAEALGKRIRPTGIPVWLEIVGVVAPIKIGELGESFSPHMYFHHGQDPQVRMNLVVRTDGQPESVALAVQERVRRIDPEIPLYDVRTMEQLIGRTLQAQRLTQVLLTAFALLALLLGAIGIYGVMSLYVASRKRELGIRLALGERPSGLRLMVLREGVTLVAFGIALGVLGALLLTESLSSLLYQVDAADPLVFTAVAALLVAVALSTCYLPAHRASRLDPLIALRHE